MVKPIEPDHIPIAKFLAMERILIDLIEDNKKLKRYAADHGMQLKDLFIATANTVSKAEFLAAAAAQKYYTNRSEHKGNSSSGNSSGPAYRERHGRSYERPDTGNSRPNTGIVRPNTGNDRPNSDRPNTGKSVKEDDDKSLEEIARRQVREKVDTRLVEKADSYYALGIANKEDKLNKDVAILEHVIRNLEADAEDTYQKVEYLEHQLMESRNQVEELTTKLKKVERNYVELKRTVAADQQIILNRLDSLQSDHSSQKEYVHSLHSNVEKNFKNVKKSILRVSSYNNQSIKEAMAAAVSIAMGDDVENLEKDISQIADAAMMTGTFGSTKRRASLLRSSLSSRLSEETSDSVEEIEVIDVRPVMKEALYPTLNLQKSIKSEENEQDIESTETDDDGSIRYVNDGNEIVGNGHMSFMDILKHKGKRLSPKFPDRPMYESAQHNVAESLENHVLSSEDKNLLSEANKRLDKVEMLLPALTFRIDNSADLVEKLHSAVRLLDSEHNGLLASHKELMRKTDRSEAVTLSILDQIIHSCETCQAAVERQEGLSLEQARQFRIISDRLKKTGKGENSSTGNNGRLTFSNASYATPALSALPNIQEWEAFDKGLGNETIDNATIMRQLDEYRKLYRSMVLEMNQIMNNRKENKTPETADPSPPRHLNVVLPRTKDSKNIKVDNSNEDIKNMLQRSDISYNPTIVYLKDEMENMKKALAKIQKVQVMPVPKQTIVADVGSKPVPKRPFIKFPRPASSKSEKQSRGSVDFNLDDDEAEQSLMADIDPSREHVAYHDMATIPTRPSSKPTVQKFFEKYKKNDNKVVKNNENDNDNKVVKNNKPHQFIRGDWPDNNDDNNNNNDNKNISNNDITITTDNVSDGIMA